MIHSGYKVVTQRHTSCMACGKYNLHYPLGEVVCAPDNTLGVMIFDIYANARAFAELYNNPKCPGVRMTNELFIILLVTYDDCDVIAGGPICPCMSEEHLEWYYSTSHRICWYRPPTGTVFCRKVKVIAKEEVTPS